MLHVHCPSSELEEYGERVGIGDRLERLAVRAERGDQPMLDVAEWVLDRYAGLTGAGDLARVSGRVAAIEAVFFRFTHQGEGWRPRPGSAALEPLISTERHRQVEQRLRWVDVGEPGGGRRSGAHVVEEGDEGFGGWLLALVDESVEPVQRPAP